MPEEIELSEREREILRLVATGASNKEIAVRLYISPNTVKVHLRNIFAKVGAASRTEATLYAIRTGLAPAPAPAGSATTALLDTSREAAPPIAADAPILSVSTTLPAPAAAVLTTPARPARLLWLAIILAGVALVGLLAWLVWPDAPQPTPAATLAASTTAAQTVPARWSRAADLPVGLSGAAGAVFENRLYVAGGETDTDVSARAWRYDPHTEAWEPLADKPTPVTAAQAALLGEKIYLAGGRGADGAPSAALEIYDPRGDRWTRGADLPAALSGAALAAFEGRLYLFGGWDGQTETAAVYAYDPAANRWEPRATLPAPRAGAGAAVSGGKVLIIGGQAAGQPLARVDAYAPARDVPGGQPWEALPDLPAPRAGPSAAALAERVYLAGGLDASGAALPLLGYSSDGATWQELEAAPQPPGEAALLLALDTHLHLLGGRPPGATPSANHLAYQAIYTVLFPVIR